ncbi:MAG: hypothetical protein AB1546_02940, partial [bacterium]
MKRHRNKRLMFLLLYFTAFVFSLVIGGCGGGGKGGGGGQGTAVVPQSPQLEAAALTLLNDEGKQLQQITEGDTVYFGMTGLLPGELYTITIVFPDGTQQELHLSADETGTIPSSAVLLYDAGLEIDPEEAGAGRTAGRFALAVGDSITVIVSRGTTTLKEITLPYSGSGTDPKAYAANKNSYFRNSFVCSKGEDIYVAFRQIGNEKVRIYIVEDRMKWNVGDRLEDVSGGFEEIQLIGYSWDLYGENLLVWKNSGEECAPSGNYDLIVERGMLDGFFDEGDLVDSHRTVGFVVQEAAANGDIIEQIASDKDYRYKNIFAPDETVYVYMNPKIRSRVFEQMEVDWFGYVQKFVTHHKDVWKTGDSIIDATKGIEGDILQWGCYNESLVVVWPAPLQPGKYDIVIDANANDIYDQGIDFLDNINENGQPEYGFLVQAGGAAPCPAQCVDDSNCVDDNPDTTETCVNGGTCNAVCYIFNMYCDLKVDKVNYTPGEQMQITFTGRNEGTQDARCGAAVAPQKQNSDAIWNSFDEDLFIVIPPGHEVTRTVTKIIPTEWAPTDTSEGSDYDIYTIREDRTRWAKGDNFNIHIRKPCNAACKANADCNDNNTQTVDSCANAGTCEATCINSPCSVSCTT